ncbi:hypothetical protein DFA_11367 [Cavenderia fasciculata]|uniref:Transmembrane protein n=1 Tax=Cavenderia fasciculata TaxID=261658 RepID=F4QCH1_CACFS|nr:uncharacterized protein DFA_11367 [Cavenderia fasciculata]EGG13606.1 hypothetical protein DFA_11367 [Cavenderia fasciculata]|eukprot:XP_004350310.1 hypothetical protein DFA_11367 [Cavenderia fasciculata]
MDCFLIPLGLSSEKGVLTELEPTIFVLFVIPYLFSQSILANYQVVIAKFGLVQCWPVFLASASAVDVLLHAFIVTTYSL